LQKEALELLKPKAGLLILDGTCGGGGHTEALLKVAPMFWLWIRILMQSGT
jgi:16S rRNA C1402 N4-methylase RsmH